MYRSSYLCVRFTTGSFQLHPFPTPLLLCQSTAILLSVAVIFSYLGTLAPFLGCLHASSLLHRTLLRGILTAPSYFFDITPTGRILARFSSDIDIADQILPWHVFDCLLCSYKVNIQFLLLCLKRFSKYLHETLSEPGSMVAILLMH